MDWVKHQLETRGIGQGELAAAIGLSESQMSKVFGGTRRLTAREADDIRRFFGYRLPDDPMDAAEARVFDRLSTMRADQIRAVELYLEALAGNR